MKQDKNVPALDWSELNPLKQKLTSNMQRIRLVSAGIFSYWREANDAYWTSQAWRLPASAEDSQPQTK